jgi:hypothetical protein
MSLSSLPNGEGNKAREWGIVVKEISQENEGSWKKRRAIYVDFVQKRRKCPCTCSSSFVLYTYIDNIYHLEQKQYSGQVHWIYWAMAF